MAFGRHLSWESLQGFRMSLQDVWYISWWPPCGDKPQAFTTFLPEASVLSLPTFQPDLERPWSRGQAYDPDPRATVPYMKEGEVKKAVQNIPEAEP